MYKMMNGLKVSTRLALLIGLMSSILLAVGLLGLFGIARSNEALQSVYVDRTLPAGQIGEIRALMLRNRLALSQALLTPTPEVISNRIADIDRQVARIDTVWSAYTSTHMTDAEQALVKTFVADRARFVNEGVQPAVAALRANDLDEARRVIVERLGALFAPAEKGIEALVQIQFDAAKEEFATATARYTMIRTASIAAIVAGILLGGGLGVAMARGLTRQLGAEPGDAASVAQAVAAGDLTTPIAVRAGDTTSLMAQLRRMQDSLSTVVAGVRRDAEGVATASAQIAQGNQDLSQRTEEQASALEQTAASMEELGATVRQNADNARQANQLALGACNVAVEGGTVVDQVVDTMKGINESARRIADIIGVIDGIAFQTNILALNAAVEAARAGEQGRGFAVVASEVRSLAQRSADAAKDIKRLITASVDRVEQGTALVGKAGSTMQEVVTSIKRVTDLMGEISSSSVEQSDGVAQVGEAVSQMDRTTQQNAALVEESAAAAESLRDQAQRMVETVAVFKVARVA